jgi:hypothetical protein
MVEVRGERLDYLQVWDHQRERGGYVRASQLRRTSLSLNEADELLAVLRHVAITPGNILPPAATTPGIGYAEFAGWVPGGAQLLVARESRGEGRYRRSFEMVRMAGLTTEHQAADPTILGAFQRGQDPAWKRMTVSVR